MPHIPSNTDNQPCCENCDFFKKHDDESSCERYNFIMPQIGWYTICHDWQSQGKAIDLSNLEPRKLYYYSQARAVGNSIPYTELASFQELRHKIISVSIRRDKEHGWVIYPRKQYRYFPSTGDLVTIIVGDRKSKFEIINEERNLAFELIPNDDSTWERQDHLQHVFMLASVESSDLLYDWYNSLMDIETYVEKESVSPSLHAFLMIDDINKEYRLLADLFSYHDYLR